MHHQARAHGNATPSRCHRVRVTASWYSDKYTDGDTKQPMFKGRLYNARDDPQDGELTYTSDELRTLDVVGGPVCVEHDYRVGRVGRIVASEYTHPSLYITGVIDTKNTRLREEIASGLRSGTLADLSIAFHAVMNSDGTYSEKVFDEASLVQKGFYENTNLVAVRASSHSASAATILADDQADEIAQMVRDKCARTARQERSSRAVGSCGQIAPVDYNSRCGASITTATAHTNTNDACEQSSVVATSRSNSLHTECDRICNAPKKLFFATMSSSVAKQATELQQSAQQPQSSNTDNVAMSNATTQSESAQNIAGSDTASIAGDVMKSSSQMDTSPDENATTLRDTTSTGNVASQSNDGDDDADEQQQQQQQQHSDAALLDGENADRDMGAAATANESDVSSEIALSKEQLLEQLARERQRTEMLQSHVTDLQHKRRKAEEKHREMTRKDAERVKSVAAKIGVKNVSEVNSIVDTVSGNPDAENLFTLLSKMASELEGKDKAAEQYRKEISSLNEARTVAARSSRNVERSTRVRNIVKEQTQPIKPIASHSVHQSAKAPVATTKRYPKAPVYTDAKQMNRSLRDEEVMGWLRPQHQQQQQQHCNDVLVQSSSESSARNAQRFGNQVALESPINIPDADDYDNRMLQQQHDQHESTGQAHNPYEDRLIQAVRSTCRSTQTASNQIQRFREHACLFPNSMSQHSPDLFTAIYEMGNRSGNNSWTDNTYKKDLILKSQARSRNENVFRQ